MKPIAVTLAAALLLLAGCASSSNPYEEPPFYAQFLNTGSDLDKHISAVLAALRENPGSPALHNELGSLLVQKDFPNDAQVEFERAINLDTSFYPAWYNLGLVRMSQGNMFGARHAFRRTVHYRKGHSAALFQLGLMEEKAGDSSDAVWYYAKAFRHNPAMLDVRVNPSILDSRLTHLALIYGHDRQQSRQGLIFEPAYDGYRDPEARKAPSKQPAAEEIITPAPPVTDPGTQQKPPGT